MLGRLIFLQHNKPALLQIHQNTYELGFIHEMFYLAVEVLYFYSYFVSYQGLNSSENGSKLPVFMLKAVHIVGL